MRRISFVELKPLGFDPVRLTTTQLALLRYIADFVSRKGQSPSGEEMADFASDNYESAACERRKALLAKGLLSFELGVHRSYRVTPHGRAVLEAYRDR